jgi:hypothetical protein
MLAHHPITGKEIKVLKTEVQLYKNHKTLLWLRDSPQTYEHSNRLKRWDTIVFGHELSHQWKPSATVIREPTPSALEWIITSAPRRYELLFFSKDVLNALTVEKARALEFTNIICLEELGEIYPQLLRLYTSSDSDADVFLMIAVLFRATRAFGLLSSELSNPLIKIYNTNYNLQVDLHQTPEPLWLIQQYYVHPNSKRASELKHCLEKNIENPLIDRIILLNEKKLTLPKSDKIQQVILGRRMRYRDVFEHILKIPTNIITVFSNSDIYLTDSFRNLWTLDIKDKFLSLLRYEENTNELFGPRPDSQDTWVVRSDSVQSRQWDMAALDFEFGKAGCDNAINVELLKKKFVVANPSLSLKTMHVHTSEVRDYNPLDPIDKPFYLYLDPTGLHDLEPKQDLDIYKKTWSNPVSYSCRVNSADDRGLRTFCAMASRNESTPLTSGENILAPSKDELFEFKNSFMTPNSLVYGYKAMYLSRNQSLREMWIPETISHMTPCIGVNSVLAVPTSPEAFTDHSSFVISYLSKIIRLREEGHKGDFWLPRETKQMHEWLSMFMWDDNNKTMPVLPRDHDVAAFATKVSFLTPRDSIHKEDIEALRKNFKSYQKVSERGLKQRIVILQDDALLTKPIVSALENVLEENNYIVDILYINRSTPSILAEGLVGADICISGPGSKNYFWLLPTKTKIIDCMAETSIEGTAAQMAGACDLEYWVVLLPRGKPEAIAKLCSEKCMKTLLSKPKEIIKLPIIVLPVDQQGLHSHKGDSFREMVSLWQEKGYVSIENSKETPYVWFNKIGDILLYDRANYEWLNKTPTTYKKILCGNPDATKIQDGVQWSFWPRNPKLVENLATRLVHTERTKSLVFYGGAENSIQKAHRSNRLSEACDEYSLTDGTTYKYTPTEYLEALAQSKFGLCLAGFGSKCNREIECMALGTVPLVAPDVDMDNYINPPQENIHYIRLKSFEPEDAKIAIQISNEKWKEMSMASHTWWKENASAEGLWILTKNIVV